MTATPSISQTGVGRSTVVRELSSFTNPYNVGLIAVVTGTATFNIEITPDDPMLVAAGSLSPWVIEPNFSAKTATTVASSTVPAKGISINITSGTGTVDLYIIQAGMK